MMCIILWQIYPFYQYYIDPDATAYLTIAKRYVAGDYDKAINGYWSPWSTWLTALFAKQGLELFAAAITANAVGAAGFLYISQSLWLKLDIRRDLQWVFSITLGFFLCYAVFKQTFDDLWECFFLLATLRIMLANKFIDSPVKWVVLGLVGALAYLAKAYAFPFFILNTFICTFFVTKAWQAETRVLWLKISAVSILAMIAASFPWMYLLHEKYGMWMTGTAGKLNLSWYLVGHPYWKEGVDVLVPPVYEDSPYYWEDPWVANGATPVFYSSFKLLALQVVRMVLNALKFVQSMTAISAFYALTWLAATGIIFSRRLRDRFGGKAFVVSLSFLLFPLPFLLINFEPRYIWFTVPLSMLLGGIILERMLVPRGSLLLKRFVIFIFAASYLVVPVKEMQEMYGEGREQYLGAQDLQKNGIQGSFTTNLTYGSGKMAEIARLAYFSGMQYYNMPNAATPEKILADMRRYKVKYYFNFHNCLDAPFLDENGQPFPEVAKGAFAGLSIYLVNP